jgi:hypothetical protein
MIVLSVVILHFSLLCVSCGSYPYRVTLPYRNARALRTCVRIPLGAWTCPRFYMLCYSVCIKTFRWTHRPSTELYKCMSILSIINSDLRQA